MMDESTVEPPLKTNLIAQDLGVVLDAAELELRAVDALSLTLQAGETFALVGESGCGKSMTALALLRLLPEAARIDSGRVELGGQDVLEWPERRMRAVRGGRIGMIFQEPSTCLNPVMRVGAQVVESIEAHTALRGAAARQRAVEWLARVGLPEPEKRIDDYPFMLSGGQKQRVMIAMALAGEPEFLLADEPTTALDVSVQAQILTLLADLQRERGLGLMLITHDLAVVSGVAHQVALMYAGQIVELAPAREFFAQPLHPYARLLLDAVPEAGKRDARLAAIAGTVPPLTQHFSGCRFADRCDRVFDACRAAPVPLFVQADGRQVRCLLHGPGREVLAGSGVLPDVARDSSPPAPALPAPGPHSVADAGRADLGHSPTRMAASTLATGVGGPPLAPAPWPLLSVQNLTVRFARRKRLWQRQREYVTAVEGVSFDIAPGETLALVGESGSGKTTVGKAITQLLRRTAVTSGKALWDGRDLFELQGRGLLAARRAIQIVFQDPYASLDPRMRVQETLEEGLIALRPDLDAPARRERLHELLGQVGLREDSLLRYPHEFSGGQRQRIAIARALAVDARLIVCDEPTSALDVSVQAQILNLLRTLQRELQLSFLFITHHIGVVEYMAHRVAVMQGGRLVEVGDAADVLQRPATAYTRHLLAAVPRLQRAPSS